MSSQRNVIVGGRTVAYIDNKFHGFMEIDLRNRMLLKNVKGIGKGNRNWEFLTCSGTNLVKACMDTPGIFSATVMPYRISFWYSKAFSVDEMFNQIDKVIKNVVEFNNSSMACKDCLFGEIMCFGEIRKMNIKFAIE